MLGIAFVPLRWIMVEESLPAWRKRRTACHEAAHVALGRGGQIIFTVVCGRIACVPRGG